MQRCKELEHYIEEYRTNRLNRKRSEITGTPDGMIMTTELEGRMLQAGTTKEQIVSCKMICTLGLIYLV